MSGLDSAVIQLATYLDYVSKINLKTQIFPYQGDVHCDNHTQALVKGLITIIQTFQKKLMISTKKRPRTKD